MHTVGGGAAIDAFEALFGLDAKSKAAPRIGVELMVEINQYMEAWARNTPYEFARNVRSFEHRSLWKMREAHQALVYQSVPLIGLKKVRDAVGEERAIAFAALVFAVHLIGGTRHEAPSKKDMDEADKLFRHYVRTSVKLEGKEFLKYKNHCLIHLANDARFYNTHLGGVDAYPFENFLSIFRKKLIKSGKNVLGQCYQSLLKLTYHCLPKDEDGRIVEYDIDYDAVAKAMEQHGSMQLPPTTIISKELNRARKSVKCLGFELTCSYPDNIAIMQYDIGNCADDIGLALIVVVRDILLASDGSLKIKGHVFKNVQAAHHLFWKGSIKSILPEPLSIIGCFEALEGISNVQTMFSFSDIIGKCFPFHMNLEFPCDPVKLSSSDVPQQSWTLVQYMHTMSHETL